MQKETKLKEFRRLELLKDEKRRNKEVTKTKVTKKRRS